MPAVSNYSLDIYFIPEIAVLDERFEHPMAPVIVDSKQVRNSIAVLPRRHRPKPDVAKHTDDLGPAIDKLHL